MKTILVTGGAGFIGSHTVDLLLQSENTRVIVYDNLVTGKITNLDLFHPRLEFIPSDVLDYPALLAQVKRCDAILHLAALSSVPRSIENPIESLKINTQGFVHVLQAVREAQKSIRVVYASSAAVYGDAAVPCNDEMPITTCIPLSPYALEKTNNERYAEIYAQLFNVPSLALRYFNVYGPRQDPNSPYSGVIAKFIESYRKAGTIIIWGDGKQSRDFIHVSDVAQANLLALQSHYTGVLNIATGIPETLANLVSYIEKACGQSAETIYTDPRTGDIRESYATVEKAAHQLNFRYKMPLSQGIALLTAS